MSHQEDEMHAAEGQPEEHHAVGAWMRANLTTQGYCLTDTERRELAVGPAVLDGGMPNARGGRAGAAVGNDGVRTVRCRPGGRVQRAPPVRPRLEPRGPHLAGGPVLPPNPRRRRDAFKVGTAWLAVVGVLLGAGATTAALVLGGLLLGACGVVTATNLCLPSEMFAWLERRRTPATKPITNKKGTVR